MEHFSATDADVLHALIQESPTPTGLYVGLEMRIHLANKAMIQNTWGKDESVLGKTIREALPELEGQPFHQLLHDVYTTGVAYEAREDLVKLEVDGQLQEFYYNFTYKPLKNKDGKVWGILNTATNVTDLVMARRRADEAEERLAYALNAANVGTWDLDIPNNKVTWDQLTKQFYGFSQSDVVPYEEVLKHIHPEDRRQVDIAVHLALTPQSGGVYDIKFRTVGADDQKLRWLHCTGKVYFNENNEPYRFSGIAQDITNAVQADVKVQSAEQMTQLAVEAVGAGTFIIDLVSDAMTYTPLFAKTFTGMERTDYTRKDFIGRIHPEDRMTRHQAYETAAKTGKLRYEARFIWDDGTVHWARTVGTYIFDENKKAILLLGIAYDITAEAEAKEEQQKLLWLIDNSNDFIALSDWSGKLTYLNKSGQQMMGFSSMEAALLQNTEYVMPEEAHRIQEEINPILLKKGRWSGYINYRNHATGERIPVYVTTLLFKDTTTGQPLGRASVVRDLRPEMKAKEEQQKLISIVENSFDCIAIINMEGDITYLNQKGKEMIGYPQQPNVLLNAGDYYFEEDRQQGTAAFETIVQHGHYEGHQRYRNLNTGAEIYAFVHATRINDAITGEMTGFSVVIRDLGPEIASQKALRDSEALFRGITTASPAALWMADQQGSINYVNQIWVDWTGRDMAQHLGTGWLESVTSDDVEQTRKRFMSDFTERRFHESQFRIKHTSGSNRWVVCTGNPQYREDGTFTGYIGACVDITEQKQLQQQKDEFIGIASHELKTPVTSIKAYTQVLEAMFRKEGDARKTAMLSKMNNQIDRLTNLIGDLLDVTKIQSGRLQFNDDYFDFNQLVAELVEDLQRTTDRHELTLQLDTAGSVYADKDRISQVITNLITNAIKYSPGANKIIITSGIKDNEVLLCVEDFGIGISADKKDRVFEQFYRVSGDKQHTFPGLGLGLYISSEIIKREGGRIWVNSIEGEGSTFCFALPVVK
ncbi:PAS domain S-box protein [Mucilaginibacter sp. Bleaf8]|uniref:PAS domain S-box protein n=1 Tax=Mucilaginibacter sp. Bleaf8 TaxID=2834430 RepID=UPI001BD1787A|nr:PAS domain S-box protein [Mucilaginibacter sp. Bleaf8]MBS7564641.1 PAS domain S-box protein [Mucilaginibacter sp. Bleaf8]